MGQETVYIERHDAISHIVLNRPDKRNALTWEMWRLLGKHADALEADDTIKAVIIRGVDDSAFAAGADIVEFKSVYADEETSIAYTRDMQDAQNKMSGLSKPTIAMIQGPCIGAGCAIAMCADVRFADASASFAVPPARLGLVYSLADTKRLVDVIGPSRAKDMIFTARAVKAEEAQAIGLINRLESAETLASETGVYAKSICALSRYTTGSAKKIVRMILDGVAGDTDETRQMFIDAFNAEDFQEGRAAFLEKRKPKFTF